MFQLELIEILNRFKKSDKFEQEKIKESISKLILEHQDEFNNFINSQSQNLDEISKNLLQNCLNKNQEIQNNKNNNSNKRELQESNSDSEIIEKLYKKWLKEYQNNNSNSNQECINIINEIVNNYADEKIEIINKILSITDSNDFNIFKIMIKNLLRTHFTTKIITYRKSDKYQNLNFIKKIFKKKEILKLYDELGKYEFNLKKIKKLITGD